MTSLFHEVEMINVECGNKPSLQRVLEITVPIETAGIDGWLGQSSESFSHLVVQLISLK